MLILWLLLTRRFRAALAAIVTMGVLAAITLPWVGVGAWFDYLRVLANIGPPVDVWNSIAPTTVLSELTGFTVARVIVLILGLGVITWAAFRRPAPISFAIALMVSILIVPTLYPHSMSLAVAPLLIYAVYSVDWVGPVTAYVALFIGGQAALGEPPGGGQSPWPRSRACLYRSSCSSCRGSRERPGHDRHRQPGRGTVALSQAAVRAVELRSATTAAPSS